MKIDTLSKQLLFNTVPIETFDKNKNSIGSGTSFIISHKFENSIEELFLITNKHVIKNAWSGYFYFTHIKDNNEPDIGNPFFIRFDPMFEQAWHGHPSDLIDITILNLSWQLELIGKGGSIPFYKSISTEIIPDDKFIESLDVLENVIFIGYPNGLFDNMNYTPIFRKGSFATPYQLDYDGRPVFLIDASVFPGSSGSPVFLFKYGNTLDSDYIDNFKLLGVVSEVFIQSDIGEIENIPAPTSMNEIVKFHQMIDLGVVIKSKTILETLDDYWNKYKDTLKEIYSKKTQKNGV